MKKKVQVEINGVKGEVSEGKTLLEASKIIGVHLAHACLGNAICSTCRVNVIDGEDSLSEKSQKEKVSLNYHLSFADETRLACQCKITGEGPVAVEAPVPFKWMVPPWPAKPNPKLDEEESHPGHH